MLYTLLAVLVVIAVSRAGFRGSDRDRVHLLWGSAIAAVIGVCLVALAMATGNLAFFYGGGMFVIVGLPLAVIALFSVYRDRERMLEPTRWPR